MVGRLVVSSSSMGERGGLGAHTHGSTPIHPRPSPQGRLRCQGRIARPEMRLLPLSFEGKASVTCKDIVNTVVVFSEVCQFVGNGQDVYGRRPPPAAAAA